MQPTEATSWPRHTMHQIMMGREKRSTMRRKHGEQRCDYGAPDKRQYFHARPQPSISSLSPRIPIWCGKTAGRIGSVARRMMTRPGSSTTLGVLTGMHMLSKFKIDRLGFMMVAIRLQQK